MIVKELTIKQIPELHEFWNRQNTKQKLVYKPLEIEAFTELFVSPWDGLLKLNLVVLENDKIIGFAHGCHKKETDIGYITFLVVEVDAQRQGVGRRLYATLEKQLLAYGVTKLEIIFFNPINLQWIVPHSDGHHHPNAPGVDVASNAYTFFKNRGFKDVAMQNIYYQNLKDFEYSDDIDMRLKKLRAAGYDIVTYEHNKHKGLSQLFDDFGNNLWRETIMSNVLKDDADPVLVVVKDDVVCGFTGPLAVEVNGRGYFAGIGIHSEHRALGAGKVLFSALCEGLKNEGAIFMTLFTGETNPARRIYESAGFSIVKSFMVMRKEHK